MDDLIQQLSKEALAYGIVAGAALLGLVALLLFVPSLRQRWLPLHRLRPGDWTGSEVFIAFCVLIGFPPLIADLLLAIGFFAPLIGPPPPRAAGELERAIYATQRGVFSGPLSATVVLGMVLGMMYARAGARPHHYGLSWSRSFANIALGLAAFLAARPLIMGLFLLASLQFPQSEPPLVTWAKRGMEIWEWGLVLFQTVFAAPVLEEVVCRGVLLGWLRRASLTGHVTLAAMALFVNALPASSNMRENDIASLVFVGLLAAAYLGALAWMKRAFALNDEELRNWQVLPAGPPLSSEFAATEEEARTLRAEIRAGYEERAAQWADANATLAIFGSAFFFAAMHSNWPGPIALFPMGLLLGWMARRTQSLIGPIVFHALFNLTSFIVLYLLTS